MVTTVTCSTSKVTVAHPVRIRILCQVTIQYELSGSFVILTWTCRDNHTTLSGYLVLLSWVIGKVSHWYWTCPMLVNGQVHYTYIGLKPCLTGQTRILTIVFWEVVH